MLTTATNTKVSAIKMAIAMIIFGSVGFFSQHTALPALELVFIRCLCATLFLGFFWITTGQMKKEVWHKREVTQILCCGVFLVLNWVYFFKTIEESGVTIAISIYHLAPVLVLLFGAVIYREKLTVLAIIALVLCFVGVLFIAKINTIEHPADLLTKGLKWGLLSALFYALLTLTGKGITKTSAYATTCIQTALGVLILLPFVDFSYFTTLTINNWIYIIVTGFLHTGIVFYLFFDSIRHLTTQLISVIVFLDPAVAILMDIAITRFSPSLYQWIGVILIFVGMSLTIRPKPKKAKQK